MRVIVESSAYMPAILLLTFDDVSAEHVSDAMTRVARCTVKWREMHGVDKFY